MTTEKFRGKFRINSVRLKNYDYSQTGAYFITIVANQRHHFFGEIVDDTMQLSDIGEIAQKFWNEIPRHFRFIKTDEFVVMPNHIHGILWIDGGNTNKPPQPLNNQKMAKISPQRGSLATVVRSYKSAVTRKSREIFPDFAWQSRFHDRIVRNDDELNRIREYIIANPTMWERDRNNF
jgi:REP element-mobilizing transposase RayT